MPLDQLLHIFHPGYLGENKADIFENHTRSADCNLIY